MTFYYFNILCSAALHETDTIFFIFGGGGGGGEKMDIRVAVNY